MKIKCFDQVTYLVTSLIFEIWNLKQEVHFFFVRFIFSTLFVSFVWFSHLCFNFTSGSFLGINFLKRILITIILLIEIKVLVNKHQMKLLFCYFACCSEVLGGKKRWKFGVGANSFLQWKCSVVVLCSKSLWHPLCIKLFC
jgi:hypothetical protein